MFHVEDEEGIKNQQQPNRENFRQVYREGAYMMEKEKQKGGPKEDYELKFILFSSYMLILCISF